MISFITCSLTFSQNVRHILIRDATVRGEEPPLYWPKGEGAAFWAAWAEEEAKLNALK